jgi:hypothetical protein
MLDSYNLSHRDIRRKIRELEEVKPKNLEKYTEREDKIRKLLELARE